MPYMITKNINNETLYLERDSFSGVLRWGYRIHSTLFRRIPKQLLKSIQKFDKDARLTFTATK